MLQDLTFREVCKLLKRDDGSPIDAVDKLLGATIVLSVGVIGPQALPALGLLRAKDEITRLGKNLLEKVTSKKEADFIVRTEQMKIAYGLMCFTAFFEALDRLLPDDLRERIDLRPSEKKFQQFPEGNKTQ